MTFYPISTYTPKTSPVDLHRPKVNAYRTILSTESIEKMIIKQFQILKILNDVETDLNNILLLDKLDILPR